MEHNDSYNKLFKHFFANTKFKAELNAKQYIFDNIDFFILMHDLRLYCDMNEPMKFSELMKQIFITELNVDRSGELLGKYFLSALKHNNIQPGKGCAINAKKLFMYAKKNPGVIHIFDEIVSNEKLFLASSTQAIENNNSNTNKVFIDNNSQNEKNKTVIEAVEVRQVELQSRADVVVPGVVKVATATPVQSNISKNVSQNNSSSQVINVVEDVKPVITKRDYCFIGHAKSENKSRYPITIFRHDFEDYINFPADKALELVDPKGMQEVCDYLCFVGEHNEKYFATYTLPDDIFKINLLHSFNYIRARVLRFYDRNEGKIDVKNINWYFETVYKLNEFCGKGFNSNKNTKENFEKGFAVFKDVLTQLWDCEPKFKLD